MFEQREQQGSFGTKWPLWVFVVLFLFGDVPLRVFAYFISEHLGFGWIAELVLFGAMVRSMCCPHPAGKSASAVVIS